MLKKILVCDDDQGILDVLMIILADNGFQVCAVSKGKGIQKKIRQFKPDIILLDIMMKGVDGREITKILRRQKDTAGIPIIILSALNNIGQIAKDIGATDFVAKPFDIHELTAKLEKY